ncbi:phosphatase PAP2 family protein [Arthrobacter sp. AL12]|uniref:phosphatase PAP2 family protein n=1 Tax=Arthrobacter sp. AL12 TaxID=3042241 RepID=UPI00249B030B|nr:phosphatase PAP2 family protein [Arthrobacter sp. AL12]MDI3212384.1 phosphatase PAP2 family protein [Arthrobacter sp. AL12]
MPGTAPLDRATAPHDPAAVDRASAPHDAPGTRPGARLQFRAIPQARHWLLWGALLSVAVLALGLAAQLVPGSSAAELGVDQDLSQHHAALLTGVAMAFNVVFGPAVGVVIVAAVALYLWMVRRSMVKAVAFGLVACSGWVASEFFKLIIARQRPNPALLFDPLSPETGSNSFPSGHVSFAVALGFALYFLARGTRWARVTAVAAVGLALVVAWSRLYIGVHYPSDVAASFLAASAAVLLLAGLWNRFAPHLLDRLPAPAPPRSARP